MHHAHALVGPGHWRSLQWKSIKLLSSIVIKNQINLYNFFPNDKTIFPEDTQFCRQFGGLKSPGTYAYGNEFPFLVQYAVKDKKSRVVEHKSSFCVRFNSAIIRIYKIKRVINGVKYVSFLVHCEQNIGKREVYYLR